MADKTAAASVEESPADLRGTLVKRLAVAGALVAVLLGVLAFFDYLAAPEEPEATVYTRPVPVAPKKEVTQPVTPAASLPEPPKPDAGPEKAETAVAAEPPPKPLVAAQPAVPETREEPKPAAETRADTRPVAAARPAPVPPAASQPTPVQPTANRPAQPETTARSAPASDTPPAGAAASRPAEAAMAHLPAPRLFSGYVLQAGVFSNAQRAEELHAKLALNGIPSTLEARVQVGPFKSRAEADAAREKMQSLGIEAVLIPPKTARR